MIHELDREFLTSDEISTEAEMMRESMHSIRRRNRTQTDVIRHFTGEVDTLSEKILRESQDLVEQAQDFRDRFKQKHG